ncbi:phosphatidylinositol-4-phosphate 5-kinase-like protein [Angomonas deanei]|uniref:MORN repeat, putative n=1 Tax=Angomonas deanei TaxID=59799 RepID=A0A7G2C1H2_9TRYP|nr:phosphatidylinositol-4-phosphate 5-kinase-like protein [Angomonas deanei]CAD2213509.1 MORN repeat, putative [Angomonas deanei]|eukprot:EPY21391.1 phosphatidylinositol-4-phosphate 5-kinase-like protein [Angomonas deanei]
MQGSPASSDAQIQKKKKLLNGVNVTFTFPSGSKYVGSFKDGKMHGYGEYTYVPSGDTYKGEWKADMKHGHGTYVYASGDKYIGEWYCGKKQGKGRFSFTSGDEYTGAWKADKMEGYGVFRLETNDNRYCGFWQDGLRWGKGILYSGNGDVYSGQWKAGKEDGFGIFSQVDGEVYCGEWKEGVMDGKGILRERGLLYLIEYMGGYIISKIPFDETEEVTEEWEKPMRHYRRWESNEPVYPTPLTTDKMVALEQDNTVLKGRLDDTLRALRIAVTSEPDDTVDKKELLTLCAKRGVYVKELEQTVEELRAKLSLIEGSLSEKSLELLRLRDELRSKDVLLSEALMKLDRIEKKRKEFAATKHTTDGGQTGLQNEADIDLVEEEMRQQNLELLRLNTEFQKKIAFLMNENATLESAMKVQEEDLEKLTNAYEETQLQYKKFSDIIFSANAGEAVREETQDDEETLAQKLQKINQLNAELTLRNSSLEKKLNHQNNGTLEADNAKHKSEEFLNEKVGRLSEQVQSLKSRLEEANDNLYVSRQSNETLRKEVQSLTDQLSQSSKRGCTDAALIKSIDDKIDRIAKLENENAELSRLLDEARVHMEEESAAQKAEKKRRKSSLVVAEQHESELEAVKKEVAKLQKKLKKTSAEKKKLGIDLYETRLSLSRIDRTFQMLTGGVAVMVMVCKKGSAEAGGCVSVNSVDQSQLLVKDDGADTSHQYDYCFEGNAAPEAWFDELRHTLSYVTLGLQTSFVTVGGAKTGKSTLINKLLPLLTEYLSAADARVESADYSLNYRLSVLEVGVHGGYDCIGKSSFRPRHARLQRLRVG